MFLTVDVFYLRRSIPRKEGGHFVSCSFTQPSTAKYLRPNTLERSTLCSTQNQPCMFSAWLCPALLTPSEKLRVKKWCSFLFFHSPEQGQYIRLHILEHLIRVPSSMDSYVFQHEVSVSTRSEYKATKYKVMFYTMLALHTYFCPNSPKLHSNSQCFFESV